MGSCVLLNLSNCPIQARVQSFGGRVQGGRGRGGDVTPLVPPFLEVACRLPCLYWTEVGKTASGSPPDGHHRLPADLALGLAVESVVAECGSGWKDMETPPPPLVLLVGGFKGLPMGRTSVGVASLLTRRLDTPPSCSSVDLKDQLTGQAHTWASLLAR